MNPNRRWSNVLSRALCATLVSVMMLCASLSRADDMDIYTNPITLPNQAPLTVLVLDLNLLNINGVLGNLAGTNCTNILDPSQPACLALEKLITFNQLFTVLGVPTSLLTTLNLGGLIGDLGNSTLDVLANTPPLLNTLLGPGGLAGAVTGLITGVLGTLGPSPLDLTKNPALPLFLVLQNLLQPLINTRVAIMLFHNDNLASADPLANSPPAFSPCAFADQSSLGGQRQDTVGCSNGAYLFLGLINLVNLSDVLTKLVPVVLNVVTNGLTSTSSSTLLAHSPYQTKEAYAEFVHYLRGDPIFNAHLNANDSTLNKLLTWDPNVETSDHRSYQSGLNAYPQACTINMLHVQLTPSALQDDSDADLKKIFPFADANNDGKLSVPEVVDAAATSGFAFGNGDLRKINSYFLVQDSVGSLSDLTALKNLGYSVNTYTDILGLLGRGQNIAGSIISTLSTDASAASTSVANSRSAKNGLAGGAYVPLFHPEASQKPAWPGNVKKLIVQLNSNGTLTLVDANSASAIAGDGRIRTSALTPWTDTSQLGPGVSVDGRTTTLGGAGQKISGYQFGGGGNPARANPATSTQTGRTIFYDSTAGASGASLAALNPDDAAVRTELLTATGAAAVTYGAQTCGDPVCTSCGPAACTPGLLGIPSCTAGACPSTSSCTDTPVAASWTPGSCPSGSGCTAKGGSNPASNCTQNADGTVSCTTAASCPTSSQCGAATLNNATPGTCPTGCTSSCTPTGCTYTCPSTSSCTAATLNNASPGTCPAGCDTTTPTCTNTGCTHSCPSASSCTTSCSTTSSTVLGVTTLTRTCNRTCPTGCKANGVTNSATASCFSQSISPLTPIDCTLTMGTASCPTVSQCSADTLHNATPGTCPTGCTSSCTSTGCTYTCPTTSQCGAATLNNATPASCPNCTASCTPAGCTYTCPATSACTDPVFHPATTSPGSCTDAGCTTAAPCTAAGCTHTCPSCTVGGCNTSLLGLTTCSTSSCPATPTCSAPVCAITPVTRSADTVTRELLLHARGFDVGTTSSPKGTGPTSSPTNSGIGARPWMLGAVIHARPLAINYGSASGGNGTVRIAYGSADGMLHMVDDATGNELWGFMPQAVMGSLPVLRDNQAGSPLPYGVDGPPVALLKDRAPTSGTNAGKLGVIGDSTDDRAYLYFGLRRGGAGYYGLNVLDANHPSLLWRITNGGLLQGGATASTGSSAFSALGLAFSTPQIGQLSLKSDGKTHSVLIFGGGYNGGRTSAGTRIGKDLNNSRAIPPLSQVGQDDGGAGGDRGNALYVVDAETGNPIWSATRGGSASGSSTGYTHPLLVDSVPSDVTILDTNNDGITDRVYFGDTGGRLWRADFPGNDPAQWTLTPLASVGRHGSGNANLANDRRIFFAPDYVPVRDQQTGVAYDVVLFGTGDREDPLNTPTQNWFYAYLDTDVISGKASGEILTSESQLSQHSAFTDATNCGSNCTDITKLAAQGKAGYRIQLANGGEKMFSSPVTLNGVTTFSTYVPPDPTNLTQTICVPNEGAGRVYSIGLRKGEARAIIPLIPAGSNGALAAPGLPGAVQAITSTTQNVGSQSFTLPGNGNIRASWRERRGDDEKLVTQPTP